MPTAEGRVTTDRGSRYLAQLCRPADQMARMRHRPPSHDGGHAPPRALQADWSDTRGTVRLSRGQ